ncbi:MAG: carbohydrate ABC transporter permease [Lachnospiraceae bacterium]|nr:carbohydrate ABC transporter permease [Lachnospiraceae bacterium]
MKTGKKLLNVKMSDRAFNVFLTGIATAWLIIVAYPLIYIISSSFSSGTAVSSGQVILWPVDFSLTGYELVLKYRMVWVGYANTFLYAGIGSLLHLIFTILVAYPLSRRDYCLRGPIQRILTFAMLFGGGLIPSYILVSQLHLVDTRFYMIISGAFSIGHIIIMRTFFQSTIPTELLESARIDGISDAGYLLKIVIPLSKASISVILLYALVGKWNDYFGPMIYLRNRDFYPLQLVVREILNAAKVDVSNITDIEVAEKLATAADLMKYSLIIVTTLPMLVLYPFLRKFFEKGVMMGSLKG